MKILMTADTVGGVWTYALELARALEPLGGDIALATMGAPPTPEQQEEVRLLDNVQLHTSPFKLEWMADPWEDVRRAGEWLLRLERVFKPDVVHLNGYVHASLPWSAPVVVVGHSCVVSWWQAVKGEPAPDEWDRYRKEVARGLQSASLVVAPTQAMLTSLESHYGSIARSRVIYNGRGAAGFRPSSKQPFVFSAGRLWDEAKNVAALEEVAPALAWPVCVAGDDEHPDGGSTERKNVKLLGKLAPQVMSFWYGRAAVYALPARYEPFGLSALEAALAGCALVLGDIPSLREVWGDAAVFVSPDDVRGLNSAIGAFIEDESVRRDYADRARERSAAFTPQRMAAEYMDAYTVGAASDGDRINSTPASDGLSPGGTACG